MLRNKLQALVVCSKRWLRLVIGCTLFLSTVAHGLESATGNAALLAKYGDLTQTLKDNQFQRPIYLDSAESADNLQGNIYAVINQSFADTNKALIASSNWCDMLILHLNTKSCRAETGNGKNLLQLSIGKKDDQPIEDAYQVDFKFAVIASTAQYLNVTLDAKEGPVGTRDYRILLEAIPLPDGKTFLHLTYSYSYGMAARLAMKTYLATAGSKKVGFTRIGNNSAYIKGVRGVVERNTMRYYLAIDTYLSTLKLPASEQSEKRLQMWFDGTEHYSRQLHEVEREAYLSMKRKQIQRQSQN